MKHHYFYFMIEMEIQIFFLLQYKFYQNKSSMIILEKVQSAIKSTDMFYSKQFLRYKTNNQYKTVTGGLVTLIVLITISISFASMILDTIARVNISYDTVTLKETDPPLKTVRMGPGSNFMFGVRIMVQEQGPGNNNVPFNLSDSKRYFNINFMNIGLQSGIFANYKPIPLQTCTKEHWSDFPNIVSQYEKMQMGRWLCPILNSTLDLEGQYSSDFSKLGMFTVTACNNYTNMNAVQNVCATPQEITAYFEENVNFLFSYLFTNSVINAGKTSYIDYYLQSSSQAIFSQKIGCDNIINYAGFQIDTDDSIWPFPTSIKDSGIILDGYMASRPMSNNQNSTTLFRLMLFKSPTTLQITRIVQKISSTFSYIGGFFGAIATALFLLKIYTDQAFEISLVKTVFILKKSVQENSILKNFNIFKFLVVKLYSLVKMVNIPWKWEKGEYVDSFQEQIKKQLDVSFILHRLINLEKMMTYMLNEEQIKELKLCKRLTLQKIKMIQERLGYTDDFLQQNQPQKTEEGTTYNIRERTKRFLQIQKQNQSQISEVRQFSRQAILKSMKENLFVENINKQDSDQCADIPVVFDKQYEKKKAIKKQEKQNAKRLQDLKEPRSKDFNSRSGNPIMLDSLKVEIINGSIEADESFT